MCLPHKKYLLLLFSSVACALLLTQEANAAPQVLAWKLSQVSSAWGPCTVYISNDAIRINAQDRNFFLLSKSPKWNIEIINETKKQSFICDTRWNGFSIHRFSSNLGHIKQYKEQKDTFMTLPAVVYSSKEKIRYENLVGFNPFDKKQKTAYITDTRYCVVQCKNIATPAATLLTKFYDMPIGSTAIPASLFNFKDGKKEYRLLTRSIKQVSIDSKIFTCKKYPKAAKAEALILAPTADATEDMLNNAGFY